MSGERRWEASKFRLRKDDFAASIRSLSAFLLFQTNSWQQIRNSVDLLNIILQYYIIVDINIISL